VLRDVDELIGAFLKFIERERTVVHRRRQSKSVFDKVLFAGTVSVIHAPQLRHRLMAFVINISESCGR
jgi:hypothetical protein